MKEQNLIFIVSQPRAGSTYLQNLLSNNPETNTCSESWILLNYASQIKPSLVQAKFDNKLAVDAFNEYVGKYSTHNFNKKQKEFVLSLYDPMAGGFKFVIDKTPRYWELLDEIVDLFPKSKIIILKRNPIDVVKSMIKTWNITTIKKLSYFNRDLLIAPKVLNDFSEKQKENPNVYSLTYEYLVMDPKNSIIDLYHWIGIEYDDTFLKTDTNIKYKGKYGDPFQNSKQDFKSEKENSNKKELNNVFQEFLKGYKQYLGSEFLHNYGAYKNEDVTSVRTKSFKYFIHLNSKNNNNYIFKKEIKYFLKEVYFRLFLQLK